MHHSAGFAVFCLFSQRERAVIFQSGYVTAFNALRIGNDLAHCKSFDFSMQLLSALTFLPASLLDL